MSTPMPDDKRHALQTALIVAVIVVGLVVVVLVGWILLRPKTGKQGPAGYTPAQETSATTTSVEPTKSAEPTSSTEPSVSVVPAEQGGTTTTTAPVRAAKVAFRLGDSIYVAGEDGAGAKAVAQSPAGAFALSPDGATLAVTGDFNLTLYPVAGGKAVVVPQADPVRPVWAPDSSAVYFVRSASVGMPQVWHVAATGGAPALVGDGAGVAVSPSGTSVALLPAEGAAGAHAVRVSSGGGAFKQVKITDGDPIAVGLSDDRVYVATLSAAGESSIYSAGLDGSGVKRLVAPLKGAEKAATYGRLLPSPSGTTLLYSAEGDDGYSRMWIVPTAGGNPSSLSARKDDYPVQWSSDGSSILFVEGNAIQGEETALYRVAPDGSRRVMVVSGAQY